MEIPVFDVLFLYFLNRFFTNSFNQRKHGFSDIFKTPVVKTVPKPKVTAPVDTGRTLVGKMPSADGGVILYYRTTDGKIEYEKE